VTDWTAAGKVRSKRGSTLLILLRSLTLPIDCGVRLRGRQLHLDLLVDEELAPTHEAISLDSLRDVADVPFGGRLVLMPE
jgi:hypothetical protein